MIKININISLNLIKININKKIKMDNKKKKLATSSKNVVPPVTREKKKENSVQMKDSNILSKRRMSDSAPGDSKSPGIKFNSPGTKGVIPQSKFDKINLGNARKRNTMLFSPTDLVLNLEEQKNYSEIEGEHKIFALSQAGRDYKGKDKTCQDSYILIDKPFDLNENAIIGICDGHGTEGHHVSAYVRDKFKELFTNKDNYISKTEANITEESYHNKITKKDYTFIKKFIKTLEDEVINNKEFDCHFSGTTCNIVLIINKTIHCLNIGDSRAVFAKMDEHQNFTVEPLSVDHKPDIPQERERILSKGGLIDVCKDDPEGPKRIWVKDEKFPGMAISRTIGDEVLKTVGVIDDPDFIEKKVGKDAAFIVTASDGIWEFISNEELMEIVKPYFFEGDIEGAAKTLVETATTRWSEEGLERDDITLVIYFFKCFKKD